MLLFAAVRLPSQESAASAVEYRRDVQPIFAANCVACHAGPKATGGLQLDSPEAILRGGKSGKVIVPGNAKQSLLAQKLREGKMPPSNELPNDLIAIVITWIDQGAKMPEDAPKSKASSAATASAARQLLDQYCVVCHNQRVKSGGLALDTLDVKDVGRDAETWGKVLRKVRDGMMPPERMPRPGPAAIDAFIGWLENELGRNVAPASAPRLR